MLGHSNFSLLTSSAVGALSTSRNARNQERGNASAQIVADEFILEQLENAICTSVLATPPVLFPFHEIFR